jgi:hypothetical protein
MKIEIKKTFKVVIVLVLCDADENRNKKNIQSSQCSGIV